MYGTYLSRVTSGFFPFFFFLSFKPPKHNNFLVNTRKNISWMTFSSLIIWSIPTNPADVDFVNVRQCLIVFTVSVGIPTRSTCRGQHWLHPKTNQNVSPRRNKTNWKPAPNAVLAVLKKTVLETRPDGCYGDGRAWTATVLMATIFRRVGNIVLPWPPTFNNSKILQSD